MDTGNDTMAAGAVNGSAGRAGATGKMFDDAKAASQRTADTLRSELTQLKSDLDTLVSRAATMSDEELRTAHAQMMAKFSSLRYAAKGFADQASRQLNRGVETTHQYVKEKPMQSVGVAVGAGLLLGFLMSRR